jgi:hypothetical protein
MVERQIQYVPSERDILESDILESLIDSERQDDITPARTLPSGREQDVDNVLGPFTGALA